MQEVHLTGEALNEAFPQLAKQSRVVARRSGQSQFEITARVSHADFMEDKRLRWGFSNARL